MSRGPGRPRHPDVLTPAEWRVAEQVRAGRTNAEIAVRLGISVNTVRFHVSHILSKLELSGREELRAWEGRPRRRRPAWFAPVLIGAGAAAAAAVLVVAAIVGGRGDGGDVASADAGSGATIEVSPAAQLAVGVLATGTPSEVTPTPPTEAGGTREAEPLPLEQHGEYREYEARELGAAGFVDTGTFVAVPLNPYPAARSSYRAGFTAVEVADAGYVDLRPEGWHRGQPPGSAWWAVNAVGLTAEVEGVRLYATFSAEWGVYGEPATQLLPAGEGQLGFYAIDDAPPQVIVSVMDADLAPVPAVVDASGHLWVRLAPIPDGPTADDTGERLDASEATVFGPLPAGVGNWPNLTWCEGAAPCIAILHMHQGGGLAAVGDGRATCDDADGLVIELATEAFTLRYVGATPNAMAVPGCEDGFPRRVRAGEMLSTHPSWEVSAFAADGTPIGVASDRARMLYVGVERTIATCPPCYTGS